jgi:hypothetical protein
MADKKVETKKIVFVKGFLDGRVKYLKGDTVAFPVKKADQLISRKFAEATTK